MAGASQVQAIAGVMDDLLNGKAVSHIDIPYAQCANVDEFSFNKRTCGALVLGVYHRDKWIILKLSNDESILIHLGLNANVLFHEAGAESPPKFDVKMSFADQSSFTLKYWMGGKFWLTADNALPTALRAREYMRKLFEQRLPCEGVVKSKSHSEP